MTRHVWPAWQLSVNAKVRALRPLSFLAAPRDRGVRPAFRPPALNSEGAVRGCWSLGESQALELVPAPHSSVAVRHRQRRLRARRQGDRGVNGGGPRQRGAGRSCRASPLRPRVRRYGPHARRSARRDTSACKRSRDTGKRRPSAGAQTAADVPALGRHADQLAFTTCDVTPMDKTISSERQYPFARSRRRSGPTSTRRSMWLAWKNRGCVRTCEGLWPLCPAAPAPASTQIVSSAAGDGITVPQVAN